MLGISIYIAHYTKFGRNVYAVGGNEQSAKMMGLPVARTKIMVYALRFLKNKLRCVNEQINGVGRFILMILQSFISLIFKMMIFKATFIASFYSFCKNIDFYFMLFCNIFYLF